MKEYGIQRLMPLCVFVNLKGELRGSCQLQDFKANLSTVSVDEYSDINLRCKSMSSMMQPERNEI